VVECVSDDISCDSLKRGKTDLHVVLL
jgi:hypothetical protein